MDSAEIAPEQYKARRLEMGLTQMELASVAGLGSQGIVSQVENGLKPGPGVERRLREALGLIGDSRTVTRGTVKVTADGS